MIQLHKFFGLTNSIYTLWVSITLIVQVGSNSCSNSLSLMAATEPVTASSTLYLLVYCLSCIIINLNISHLLQTFLYFMILWNCRFVVYYGWFLPVYFCSLYQFANLFFWCPFWLHHFQEKENETKQRSHSEYQKHYRYSDWLNQKIRNKSDNCH